MGVQDGKKRWAYPLSAEAAVSPIVGHDLFLFGCVDGIFRAVDRREGQQIWFLNVGAPIRSTASLSGDKVYFGGDNRGVYVVELD